MEMGLRDDESVITLRERSLTLVRGLMQMKNLGLPFLP